jgi:hypothetical protein
MCGSPADWVGLSPDRRDFICIVLADNRIFWGFGWVSQGIDTPSLVVVQLRGREVGCPVPLRQTSLELRGARGIGRIDYPGGIEF